MSFHAIESILTCSIMIRFSQAGYLLVQQIVSSWAQQRAGFAHPCRPRACPHFMLRCPAQKALNFPRERGVQGYQERGGSQGRAEMCTVIGRYWERGPGLRGQRIVYMSQNPSPGRLLSCQPRTCLDPHSPGGQRTAASSPVLDGQTTWDIYLQQDSLYDSAG